MLRNLVIALCLLSTIATAENYRYSGSRHTTHQRIGNQVYSNSQFSGTWRKVEPYQSPGSRVLSDVAHLADGILDGMLQTERARIAQRAVEANFARGYQMAQMETMLMANSSTTGTSNTGASKAQ